MNMPGIIEPVNLAEPDRSSTWTHVRGWMRRNKNLLLVVVLPTLLAAIYLFGFASDQYESEAHFLVRSSEAGPAPAAGVGQMLSLATGGGLSGAQNEAMSVADYLTSHDVVATLQKQDRLIERFHRSEVDFLSRLRSGDPSSEQLLKYYRKQIRVEYDTENGITTLKVHAFTPQDAYEINRRLLELGEQQVNHLNQRSYQDAIALGQKQLADAESALAANQIRMTAFRQNRADIDPEASGKAQIGLVTTLTEQLAGAKAQLNAMSKAIQPSSPQYRALAERVHSLSAQIAAQSGRLTGSNDAIAADISGYEELKLRQEFLGKRYDAAAMSLERAREQAMRQQLYVVRVVDANMPMKALYPERWRILATVFIGLMLAFSIGWLIAAGVREHAA